jgi:hypothetical protein
MPDYGDLGTSRKKGLIKVCGVEEVGDRDVGWWEFAWGLWFLYGDGGD